MASCFSPGEKSDQLEIGLFGCFEEACVHHLNCILLTVACQKFFQEKSLQRCHRPTHNIMMNSGFVSPINSLAFKNM